VYQALYRKWRPKAFADVVGQEHITDTLRRQAAEGRLSHAYLFTGTRGTGKTTCAKILAKAVNCENPQNGDPCNACPSCLGIDSGALLDVLELDAASNNGVDHVRALRDEAIYSPAKVRRRVYIIDEVHMLSTPAFNALLKILEEPPAHLMFILATTELHKVPATILSRCQRFAFKRILPRDIIGRLERVAVAEGIDLRPDGAELLARLADGGLRDALALLDQCAAVGGAVDSRQVLDTLGLAGNLQTAELMEHILQRDTKSALLQLHQLYADGKDVASLLNELSTLSRDLLISMTAPEGGAALLSGGYDAAAMESLGRLAEPTRLIHITRLLQETAAGMQLSLNRRTDAELCLMRLCDDSLCGDLTALAARVARLEKGGVVMQQAAPAAPAPQRPTSPKGQSAPAPVPEPIPAPIPEPLPAPVEDVPPWEEPPLPDEPPPLPEEPPMEREPIRQAEPMPAPIAESASVPAGGEGDLWNRLREKYKNQLPAMCRAFLDSASGTLEGDTLQVVCANEMVRDILRDRAAAVLQSVTGEAVGRPVNAVFSVGQVAPAQPKNSLDDLLSFGSRLDNFTVKGE